MEHCKHPTQVISHCPHHEFLLLKLFILGTNIPFVFVLLSSLVFAILNYTKLYPRASGNYSRYLVVSASKEAKTGFRFPCKSLTNKSLHLHPHCLQLTQKRDTGSTLTSLPQTPEALLNNCHLAGWDVKLL